MEATPPSSPGPVVSEHTIRGRVILADGSPARARVHVERWDPVEGRRDDRSATCDELGFFETEPLADAAYTVVASHRGRGWNDWSFGEDLNEWGFEEDLDESEETSSDPIEASVGPERSMERVMLDGVRPGTSGIVLQLPVLALRGTLHDDNGAPLDDFLLVARRGGFERHDSLVDYVRKYAEDGIAQTFRASGGRFVLQGFTEGRWTLLAWARSHGLSQPREVSLPASEELELVLPRGGRIEGTVVNPSGNGVPAEIVLQEVAPFGSFDNADWPDEGFPTAPDGTFALDVIHGTAHLYARSESFAPSQVTLLSIEPGSLHPGVRLTLELAGRIAVELVDAAGAPVAGLVIELRKGFVLRDERRETDAEGRAIFDRLTSGEYVVEARTYPSSRRERIRSEVELDPGESERVVLRLDEPPPPPPHQPVRVFGRALDGAEPIKDRPIWFMEVDGDRGESVLPATDGTYSVVLPAPGRYQVLVAKEGRGRSGLLQVEVPAHETFEWNILLGGGGIAGFVRGPNGEPIAGAIVRAVPEDGSRFAASEPVETDAGGAYTLSLPPGEYRVLASEQDWDAWGMEVSTSLATAERRGVVVEASEVQARIDFGLVAGGILEGTVRLADGTIPLYAIAFVDSEPPVLSICHAGAFRIAGVPPGSTTVSAFFEGFVSQEPVSFDVAPGTTASAELILVHATEVEFRTFDAHGDLVDAEFVVVPARGISGGEFARGALLPDGQYTLRTTLEGRTAECSFEIAGEEKKVVELRAE